MDKRTFIFGSEWLFLKIYSGPKTLENIFVNEIVPQLNKLLEKQSIDYFFFIRYQDPDYHIRLRLHLKDIEKIGEVIFFLNRAFEEYVVNQIISRIIIDTYNREIERYGENFIIDIEKVFFYDSLFIVQYLSCNDDENEKWLVSVKYIDLILDRCGFSLDEKIDLCNLSSLSFSNEIFRNSIHVNKLLNSKYRDVKNKMTKILSKSNTDVCNYDINLNQYLDNIVFFTSKFCDEKSNINRSDFCGLLTSVIHMHVNRMFRTKQRVNECVIYYLLLKFYRSKKARVEK